MPKLLKKEVAHQIIDNLPDTASWDDLIYEIYVRQVVEQGTSDSDLARVRDVVEIRKKYGLQQ